ncbi:prepilin peptidase [Candidatus Peregrinibacteria bacterium CG10_big_fil_rev_8_21_14_0_10_55_24]|nr:MAG: prepilin peptidase [Candidatus Peregrinibacteria bacterium CG10_big_fil_rev_8_21_14_0_10_55_24]
MQDSFSVVLFVLVGALLGSFGNVLTLRLPRGESIGGRSHCPHCSRVLRAWELIPVVSFMLLRGRCSTCHGRIAWRYPMVEVSSAGLFLLALSLAPGVEAAALLALSLWLLLLIAIIDAQVQGIPDVLNFTLLIVAGAYAFVVGTPELFPPLLTGGFFFFQWAVSRGRWTGSGDIILGTGIGLLLPTVGHALLMLACSYILGAGVATVLLLSGRSKRTDHLAFAPFLALGTLLTLLWGDVMLGVLLG